VPREPVHWSLYLGVILAGLGAGLWASDAELAGVWQLDREFEPRIGRDEAAEMQRRWRRAVERSLRWVDDNQP